LLTQTIKGWVIRNLTTESNYSIHPVISLGLWATLLMPIFVSLIEFVIIHIRVMASRSMFFPILLPLFVEPAPELFVLLVDPVPLLVPG